MPSRFIPIPPSTDHQQQIAMLNKNFAELDHENVTKLFYDEDGLPSIMIGVQPDKTSRIRIAKPGLDVTTATDDQLAFNSAQNVFKIVDTDTVTLNRTAGNHLASLNVAHGLSFVPAALCFILNSGAYIPLPYLETTPTGAGNLSVNKEVTFTIDGTNINFFETLDTAGLGVGASESIAIRYYLLQETAN